MAKDAKTAKLPTAVPAAAQKTLPDAAPLRKRKVTHKTLLAPANTVLTDPASIVDGIKAEYGWDEPEAVVEETPLEPTVPDEPAIITPTAPKPAPAAPAAPAHSAVSLHLAKQLGITDAEVADSTPKELDRLVTRLSAQREELRREHVLDQAKQVKRNPVVDDGAAPTKEPGNAGTPDAAISWGVDEDGSPVDPELIHTGIRNAFKAQAKEIADLKKLVGQLAHREIGREQQTQAQKLDSLFAQNAEMFGAESADKIKATDPAKFQRRLALLTVMKALQSGSMDERFAEAHEIMYGKPPAPSAPTAEATPTTAKSATPPRDDTGKFVKPGKGDSIHDADEWAEAGSAVPTNRMEPVFKGKKSAVDNVSRLLKENPGLLPDDDYSSEFLSSNGQV